MNRGLRRCAVLLVLVGAGVLVLGAQAASAQVIEICKSSANGMSGRDFSYTVSPSGGSSFAVGPIKGGRCSGPITVTGASATITEAQSDPATDVRAVTVRPSARKTSEDLANRKVTVVTGASTSSETLVTFTNQPAGGNYGTLKVCKLTETPAFLGRAFSFSVNGGPVVSTEANDAFDDPANYSCRILGTFQQGSVVHVHEQIPAGTEVQWIDTDPGDNLGLYSTTTGDADVTITPGVTVVYYDNEPTPPSGTGYLEICKNADPYGQNSLPALSGSIGGYIDEDVHGTFNFTITDAAEATHSVSVEAGQCSAPIQVAAGVNLITEEARSDTQLTDVDASPEDRLLTVNLINRTATVEVPVSDSPNDETQVFFFNQLLRGQLKLCKALGAGSADLVGQHFDLEVYDVSDPEHPDFLGDRSITAAASTQCVIFGFLPIGLPIKVVEHFGDDDPTTTMVDESGQFIKRTGPVNLTIAPGVNTATITNTAQGLLEVCKAKIRAEYPTRLTLTKVPDPIQPKFQFKIDNGQIFSVQAGKCSQPMPVGVGNHTVTEVAANDYELDPDAAGNGITVYPADREVSRSLSTRSVQVSVPYGINGETLVTFTNRIKRGMVKVCKVVPETSMDALGTKEFQYVVTYRDPWGNLTSETLGPITQGECTSFSRSLPVLQPSGKPTAIGVAEQPTNGNTHYTVQSITLQGTRGLCPASPSDMNADPGICDLNPNPDLVHGWIDFYLAPGPNVVTYTNKAVDP